MKVEAFGLKMAKFFLGKNVNLHLKDGSVIVNVQLTGILEDEFGRKAFVKCIPYGNRTSLKVPIKSIARAEPLNISLIKVIR